MGHDEDKNNFDTNGASTTPVKPNPLATITSGNRLGMRQSRNISAAQAELDRISADSNPNAQSGDDIVLNSGNTDGGINKKYLIIGVLLVVSIIAAILSVMVTSGGIPGIGKNNTVNVSSATKSAFSDFTSTYLGSNANFSELYKTSDAYNVDDAIESGDKAFFGTSKQKLEALTNSLDDKTDESVKTMINQYSKLFNFVYAYGTTDVPTEEKIIAKYTAGGRAGAEKYITDAYAVLLANKYDDSDDVTNADKAYYLAMVNQLDLYTLNGCLTQTGSTNEKCLVAKIGAAAVASVDDVVFQANQKRGSFDKFVNLSKRKLWDINTKMNGENK